MPSTPPTPLSTSCSTFSSSSLAPVSLRNWWLIKSEDVDGKRLAVGGYYYPCETTMYIFTSAPIVKRVNLLTVETADGYTLRLLAGMDKSRTEYNGFPSEVLDSFFLGFPFNWEHYAKQDFGNGPMVPRPAAFSTSCASKPKSPLDDMVIKKPVSSSVNTDVNNQFPTSETISRCEKDGDERCSHLISTLNMNYENQNETRQTLQAASFSNKRLEINNEKIKLENTSDYVDFVDDVSPLEILSCLRTQQCSQQANIISNMECTLPVPAHQNADTECNSHASFKDNSTISSSLSKSLFRIMKTWKPVGLGVKPNRGHPPNDSDCNLGLASSECKSDNPEMHGGTLIRNHDDINSTAKSEEIEGITNNLDENQNEAMHEALVNNFKSMKENRQKKVQKPSISEEMKSPLASCKPENLNITSPSSPELVNPKRSRSGRLLLSSVDKSGRVIIYNKDGSLTALTDVSPIGSKSKKGRRLKLEC